MRFTTNWDRTINERQGIYIDSTPTSVCEDARNRSRRVLSHAANWAYSSTGAKFGHKMHAVVDADQKIQNFTLKPKNLHDVTCAEEVPKDLQRTV
ncbi:MAG: transposase [Puniceicoccales bacterium]|nr:transposase [Puniceicoccales bacterium]